MIPPYLDRRYQNAVGVSSSARCGSPEATGARRVVTAPRISKRTVDAIAATSDVPTAIPV